MYLIIKSIKYLVKLYKGIFMKNFVFYMFLSVVFCVFGVANDTNIMNPRTCMVCHNDVYKDWVTSLHSKSHEDSNELYSKAINLAVSENIKTTGEMTVLCSKCHNPRLKVKKLDNDTILANMLDINTDKSKELQEALKADDVKTGVSCYICHNVDGIKANANHKESGYLKFNWTEGNLISGPYEIPADASVFHKNQSRDFFRNSDELCLSCHQGQATDNPNSIYNTGVEAASVGGGDKRCVDCHMGDFKKGIISPNFKRENMVERDLRSHLFAGARNSDILKTALEFNLNKVGDKARLNVKNLISHGVPTGFSGRSVVLRLSWQDGGANTLATSDISLRASYKNSILAETLFYVATIKEEDTRLKAHESRDYELDIPSGASKLKIEVIYYVLAPELQETIKLKDETYTKPYPAMIKSFDIR